MVLLLLNIIGNCLLQGRQNWEYIYDVPNGAIVDSLMNDTINENYVFLNIYEFKDSFAMIKASYLYDNREHIGWIKQDALGIYLCTDTDSIVYLYSQPNYCSKIYDILMNPIWGDLYKVTNAEKGWLYIDDRDKKGWVPSVNQCSNPYTSCN